MQTIYVALFFPTEHILYRLTVFFLFFLFSSCMKFSWVAPVCVMGKMTEAFFLCTRPQEAAHVLVDNKFFGTVYSNTSIRWSVRVKKKKEARPANNNKCLQTYDRIEWRSAILYKMQLSVCICVYFFLSTAIVTYVTAATVVDCESRYETSKQTTVRTMKRVLILRCNF